MNGFRSMVGALGTALAFGAILVTPALAWSGDLEGQPGNLHAGGDLGYYVWHDDAGLHLRTTGPGPRHAFNASLQTDGEFAGVQLIRLEGVDFYALRDGGHVLDLHFETFGGVDGVDFYVNGGQNLRLALRLDGGLIPTEQIFLGSDAQHPTDNPFFEQR